ncbi:MAG: hypothetical protein AAF721_21285 [Myxococcota bacterium]
MVDTAHGVLSAASAAASAAILVVGVWLHVALGHAPRSCVDDLPTLSFQVVSWTAMTLMAAVYLSAPIFGALTLARLVQLCDGGDDTARSIFAMRMGVVAIAWLLAFSDPTGGLDWLLD